jgi:hypothetical protein
MDTTTSVEITFLGSQRESSAGDPLAPEGVVHLPDATLRPFSGWIDLVGALEHAHDLAERLAADPQLRVGSPKSLFTQAPTGRRT